MVKDIILDFHGTIVPLAWFPKILDEITEFWQAVDFSGDIEFHGNSVSLAFAKLKKQYGVGAKDPLFPILKDKVLGGDKDPLSMALIGYFGAELIRLGLVPPVEFYDDVRPALQRWKSEERFVTTYSNLSSQMQRAMLHRSKTGFMDNLVDFYVDTSGDIHPSSPKEFGVSDKTQKYSFTKICNELGLSPGGTIYITDRVCEIRHARDAGLETRLIVRPDNEIPPHGDYHSINSLLKVT